MTVSRRTTGLRIEAEETETGIEIREVVPGRPDSPIPTLTGCWTIRKPATSTEIRPATRSATDAR